MATIEEGRYEDTNKVFEKPKQFDIRITQWIGQNYTTLGRFQLPWGIQSYLSSLSKTGQVVILLREQDRTNSNPLLLNKESTLSRGLPYAESLSSAVPNITHITYGRDVRYTIEQEHLDKETESISATDIGKKYQASMGMRNDA